jgi:hypothetical protein
MAEVLLSPGVSIAENDTSQITTGPITAGLALVGPTVKGRVNIPTLITTYSDFQSKFGDAFESASANYEFLTSITARNYFQQGGQSILVTRVTSDDYTTATAGVNNSKPAINSTQASASLSLLTYENGTPVNNSSLPPNFQLNVVQGLNWWKFVAVDTSNGGVIPDDDIDGDVYFYEYNPIPLSGDPARIQLTDNLQAKLEAILGPNGQNIASFATPVSSIIDVTYLTLGSVGNDLFFTLGSPLPYVDAEYVLKGYIVSAQGLLATTQGGVDGNGGYAFILETISEGASLNNTGSIQTNGALANGTENNIRWQILSPDVNTGTFTLVIRQGNDTTTNPTVLESFTNVSLDPNQPNYIEAVVGNIKQVVQLDSSTGQYFINVEGNYANASRYVRVKEVLTPTYNYFNNDSQPNPAYATYLPNPGSGSFGGSFSGATGNDLNTVTNLYQNISFTTQGLNDETLTKFGNLVVDECVKITLHSMTTYTAAERIREHFKQ